MNRGLFAKSLEWVMRTAAGNDFSAMMFNLAGLAQLKRLYTGLNYNNYTIIMLDSSTEFQLSIVFQNWDRKCCTPVPTYRVLF